MGLMDRMIVNMSVEGKEEMMLKMMPAMMAGVGINKTVPGMLSAGGRLVTATGSVVLVSKALNDDELKEELGEALGSLREKMPAMAEMMPIMAPMMREMMPIMMTEKMPQVMADKRPISQSPRGVLFCAVWSSQLPRPEGTDKYAV
jgi:hypothetical protein